MHWYIDQVLRLGTKSQTVRKKFLEVQGMLKQPESLFSPSILVPVLSKALFKHGAPREEFEPSVATSEYQVAEKV